MSDRRERMLDFLGLDVYKGLENCRGESVSCRLHPKILSSQFSVQKNHDLTNFAKITI
jgi:hypothetical protein